MTADETLVCAECGGEAALLQIMRGLLMLGHVRAPERLHAVRLASNLHRGAGFDVGRTLRPTPRATVDAGRPAAGDQR